MVGRIAHFFAPRIPSLKTHFVWQGFSSPIANSDRLFVSGEPLAIAGFTRISTAIRTAPR